MKKKFIFFCITAACIFSACGDDTSISANDSGNTQISSSAIESVPTSSDAGSNNPANTSSTSIESSSATESVNSSSSKATSKGPAVNYNPETGILTDERDGEVYTTAKIGDQIWMGQNLRYRPDESNECAAVFEDVDDENTKTYGHRYDWITATNVECHKDKDTGMMQYDQTEAFLQKPYHQGICPNGWHIPSVDEWQVLLNNAPIQSLLSKSWDTGAYQGTDSYGFNILPKQKDDPSVMFIVTNKRSAEKIYVVVFEAYVNQPDVEVSSTFATLDGLYLRCLMD